MTTELINPWQIDPSSVGANLNLAWAISYIKDRGIADSVWSQVPDERTIYRLEKLIKILSGSRNWVVCFSGSPSYSRHLFTYLVSSWVLSTGRRFRIADLVDLVSATIGGTLIEEYESIDLLVIPYSEPTVPGLQKVRGSLSTLLQRRKVQGLPTIVESYVRMLPRDAAETVNKLGLLEDVFGSLAPDLFSGDHIKYVTLED